MSSICNWCGTLKQGSESGLCSKCHKFGKVSEKININYNNIRKPCKYYNKEHINFACDEQILQIKNNLLYKE